ncbi:TetR/AcrR family transcriptional regulator [Pedobacter sp. ASV28]|uniref:TetR/AcrR family transcriptional regulator n=1 Tax=Pedobacter sp. ASV28 TaxID=2795123 RepID=UPI0018EB1E6A|nr:TetR/AcrR family transcriptional regulator [Pedobacter sp. ASV28]
MSKTERTKAFIIEKTAPIFNKKGFAGTSLADITTATGLTKGSVYGNFMNKDEVALAVFDYNLGKLNNIFASALASQVTARNKLMVYATHYQQIFNPLLTEGGCPILNTATEADDTHPALREKAISAILSWKNKIRRIIEEGKQNGEFMTELDTECIALTMIAMIEGGIMIAKLTDSSKSMELIMKSMKKMIEEL